jgi:hypothetical protein
MFTWICPQCGREVPPAYNDCPDCAAKAAGPPPAAEAPLSEPQAAEPPNEQRDFGRGSEPPTRAADPVIMALRASYVPAKQPAQTAARPRAAGPRIPTWLLTVVFAFAFLGLGAGIYWLVGYSRSHGQAGPSSMVESPAAKPGAKTDPFQKYIEISGVRFLSDQKNKEKMLVKFVLTNHAEVPVEGLTGNVTVWGRTQKSEEDAEGTFTFKVNLQPFESKEMTAPLTTKLKIYELPDWQNVTTDVQVTASAEASAGSPAPR